MAALENEANPFRKQAIRKWLAEAQGGSRRRNRSHAQRGKAGTASGQSAVPVPTSQGDPALSRTESVERFDASAHFWDISNEELKLVERVCVCVCVCECVCVCLRFNNCGDPICRRTLRGSVESTLSSSTPPPSSLVRWYAVLE